jgi:hypothetical protein
VLEYSYCLNMLYWNIPTDWTFRADISYHCKSGSGDDRRRLLEDHHGLHQVSSLAVSVDGLVVYALGRGDGDQYPGSVVYFNRDSDTLELSLGGALSPDSMEEPEHLSLSPDGRHIYVMDVNSIEILAINCPEGGDGTPDDYPMTSSPPTYPDGTPDDYPYPNDYPMTSSPPTGTPAPTVMKEAFFYQGPGWCRPTDASNRVNGRVAAGVAREEDCAAECLAEANCLGYAYAGSGSSSSGRCFLHGPTLEYNLEPVQTLSDLPEAIPLEWFGYPQPDTDIAGSSVSGGVVCFRRHVYGTGEIRANVINLMDIASPYKGSTVGNDDFINPSCGGSGPEQGFQVTLHDGEELKIGMTMTTFDTLHELRYGGVYPGDITVECIDDPNTQPVSFTNDVEVIGMGTVEVYFVVDAYGHGSDGDFTLEWEIVRSPTAAPSLPPSVPQAVGTAGPPTFQSPTATPSAEPTATPTSSPTPYPTPTGICPSTCQAWLLGNGHCDPECNLEGFVSSRYYNRPVMNYPAINFPANNLPVMNFPAINFPAIALSGI